MKDFFRAPEKDGEADKVVEFVIGEQGYSEHFYLAKSTPPRVVLRIFDCASGEHEQAILNSAFEWPGSVSLDVE